MEQLDLLDEKTKEDQRDFPLNAYLAAEERGRVEEDLKEMAAGSTCIWD